MNTEIAGKVMPADTKILFHKLVKNPSKFQKEFVLIGGTGLACHLQHRFSEDLDFFCWKNQKDIDYDQRRIIEFFTNNFEVLRIDPLSENHLDMIVEGVKLSFVQNNIQTKPIKSINLTKDLRIGTLEGISICKLEAIVNRQEYRDYFDLAEISKHLNLHHLARSAASYNGKLQDIAYLRAMLGSAEKIPYENIKYLSGEDSPTPEELQDVITNKLKQELKEMKL